MRRALIAVVLVTVSLPAVAERVSREEQNILEKFCYNHGATVSLYVEARNLGMPISYATGGDVEAMTSQDFVYRFNRKSADFVWGKSRPDKKWARLWAYTECLWQIDNPS